MKHLLRLTLLTTWIVLPATVLAADPSACCRAGDAECKLPQYDGKRVALIVGVNTYAGHDAPSNQLPDLRNAIPDAKKLHGILSGRYKVRCILDPNREQFDAEFKQFTSYLEKLNQRPLGDLVDSSALFYFSGHGFRIDDVDRIILSGTFSSKQEAEKASAQTFWINRKLAAFDNIYKFVAFDACRNTPRLDWEKKTFNTPDSTVRGRRHFIFHSTNANDVSVDVSDGSAIGPLMEAVAHYFQSTGFSLERVHRLAGQSSKLQKIGQQVVPLSTSVSQLPWSGRKLDKCVNNDDAVMRPLEACLDVFGSEDTRFLKCLKDGEACSNFVDFKNHYSHTTPALCTPNELSELEKIFKDLKKCSPTLSSVAMQNDAFGPMDSFNVSLQRDAIILDAEATRNFRLRFQKSLVSSPGLTKSMRPEAEFTTPGIQRKIDILSNNAAERNLPALPDDV